MRLGGDGMPSALLIESYRAAFTTYDAEVVEDRAGTTELQVSLMKLWFEGRMDR
jgi:hypothetical protein